MKKLHPIVMLPTDGSIDVNKAPLYIDFEGRLLENPQPTFVQWKDCIYQHLYILSDEIPNVGDVVYSIRGFIGVFGKFENSYLYECSKVIATTDNSLIDFIWDTQNKDMLLIPSSFLPIFVEAYNSGKPITEVELEYDLDTKETYHEKYKDISSSIIEILKTKESNEVVISLPEVKMYTRVEMENFGLWLGVNLKENKNRDISYLYDKWVEENL